MRLLSMARLLAFVGLCSPLWAAGTLISLAAGASTGNYGEAYYAHMSAGINLMAAIQRALPPG